MKDTLKARLCPPTTMAGWIFSECELQEAVAGERLLCPSLDLSPICNLDCPYCFQEVRERRSAAPHRQDVKSTLSTVTLMAKAGARTINIIGAGEPLLDPSFEEVAKFIHKLGIHLLVTTNGVPLIKHPKLLKTLIKVKANVILKMNSMRSEIEDAMVGQLGYAHKRDLALNMLLEASFAHKNPTRLGVNTVITESNKCEILDMYRFCRERNICFIAGTYMPTGRTDNERAIGDVQPHLSPLSVEQLAQLTHAIRDVSGVQATKGDFPAYTSDLPCVQALGLYVDSDGAIWPCPTKKVIRQGLLRSEPLGTIQEDSALLNIWKSNSYIKDIRHNYSGNCPYKEAACGGK